MAMTWCEEHISNLVATTSKNRTPPTKARIRRNSNAQSLFSRQLKLAAISSHKNSFGTIIARARVSVRHEVMTMIVVNALMMMIAIAIIINHHRIFGL